MIAAVMATGTVMADDRPGVGLVLSGGGAKGIAHIGFIAALEQDSIPIDCIAGTSMGAIVGSLYASGYSPSEMMELIASPKFREWSSGQIPQEEILNFVEPKRTAQWVGVNLSPSDPITDALPTRIINPLPMSWAFMELYAPVTGACDGDFDRLMVPLRTVASNISDHRPMVFSHGELAEAVRASMSFPMVFQPIEVDGKLMFDGGLYDVYPVDVMERDFNPQHVIGLNVSSRNTPPQINSLISELDVMITDNHPVPFPPDGVNVRFHLDEFGLLDWGAADTIYAIGYNRAISMMDSIKRVIPGRVSPEEVARHRAEFRHKWKDVQFDSISISGVDLGKEEYIDFLMAQPLQNSLPEAYYGKPIPSVDLPPASIAQARDGFYNVASTGRMRNFVPHAIYNDSTGLYRLALRADVDSDYKFGVGGFLTSSAGSFLYASGRYDPFTLLRPGWSVELWGGQNYLAARAESSINFDSRVPSRLTIALNGVRQRMYETDHAFYDFSSPSLLITDEARLELTYSMMAGQHGTASVTAAVAHTLNKYHSGIYPGGEDATRRIFSSTPFILSARYHFSTIDDTFLPTSGTDINLQATALWGPRHLSEGSDNSRILSANGLWGDFKASAVHYIAPCPHFSLGFQGEAFWSVRPLLPNYECAVIAAEAFDPTPSSRFLLDESMRANQYVAVGMTPIWRISRIVQASLSGWAYMPMRSIEASPDGSAHYGKWFDRVEGVSRLAITVKLPTVVLQCYGDWRSTPAQHWSAGVSIGVPIYAPEI